MKKIKLLLAAAALMIGGSVSAQTALSGVSSITSGEQYYIVNDATGLFLTPGNNYGTRATLDQSSCGPATVTLSDGKYTIKWSYGNGLFVNADDGSSLYCDMNNQGNNYFTITPNGDNTFNVQLASGQSRYNESSYLTAASSNIFANVQYNSGNSELRKWRFISPTELKTSMVSSSSKLDVSLFVHGAQCMISGNSLGDYKKMYPWTTSGEGWKGQNNADPTGFTKPWLECWQNTALPSRSATNSIASLPAGSYTLSAYTIGGNGVTFYAKVGSGDKITAETGNGSPILSTINFDIESGSENVEFGIESTAESTSGWIAIDNIKLEYVSFSAFRAVYETALAAAQAASDALDGFSVYSSKKTSLDGIISSNTLTGDDLNNRSALTTATNNLEAATGNVEVEVAACSQYATIVSTIGENTNVDLTSFVSNPSFEAGNLTGWTSDNGGGVANNNNWEKVGTYYVERWTPNGESSQNHLSNGTLIHDGIVLPAGLYSISAKAQNKEQYNGVAGTGYFLYANDEKVEISSTNTYSTYVYLDTDKSELIIKFALENCTGNWISCDNVQLTYVGEDFPSYTLVTGNLNATVAAAQTTAENTFTSSKTVSNYNALLLAISNAQVSKDAYANLGTAIAKIDAAIEAATTATASTDAYEAIKTAYTNGTIADNDIMSQVAAAYNAVIPVIKSQTAASADFTLAIQNQSFEYGDMTGWTAASSSDTGVRETSNDTYAATGSDGKYLFNTWWQGVPLTQTVAGLPNGQYTLTASVSSDGATIYLIANGEHNDGTETGGTYPSSDTFQEATITFLVKDGTATIGVVGGADGTAGEHKEYVADGYWWYKADNCRLVKNRDLTQEEMAIVPTAISLKVGDDVVSAPIALDKTTYTVTLTPDYTPANATTGYITWETSDASVAAVADGVVTAISTGSATITVTSKLDGSVSATATINVSFPETEIAEYTNDGATRYIHHYGANLIKNGSFDYPTNNYFGWKNGAGSDLGSNGFDIVVEDEQNVLRAKNGSNGDNGGGSVKAIKTGWPIENGKTYIFGYRVKASGTAEYHVVSMTNTIGTETAPLNTSDERKAITYSGNWVDQTYEFTNSEGYSYLQFAARWLSNSVYFDDFYLVEKTVADDEIGNVQYALDAIPTANIGVAAFQYSQEAIDAVSTLVQDVATVEDVENAYDAVTTLNAPAVGKVYNIINVSDGYDYSGNAVTCKSASDADLSGNTTSFGYNETPGSIYPQGFKFTAVDGQKNVYKLSYTRADGEVVYLGTGSSTGLGSDNDQIRPTTDISKAVAIRVDATSTDNVWNLYNTLASKNIGANGKSNQGFYTVNSYNKMNIQEAEENEVALTIKVENQYGTLIVPFASEVPSDVIVYSIESISGEAIILEEVDAIAANTPYIVYAALGISETLSGLGSAYTDATYKDVNNLLTGTYTEINAPNGSHVLQNGDEGIAFYLVNTEEATPKVKPNRAYLQTDGTPVKAFFFGGGEDAIKSVFDGVAAGEIYDLSGRKVAKMQKGGAYIVNGKKVIVK